MRGSICPPPLRNAHDWAAKRASQKIPQARTEIEKESAPETTYLVDNGLREGLTHGWRSFGSVSYREWRGKKASESREGSRAHNLATRKKSGGGQKSV